MSKKSTSKKNNESIWVQNGIIANEKVKAGIDLPILTNTNDNVEFLVNGKKYPFSAVQSMASKSKDLLMTLCKREIVINARDRKGENMRFFLAHSCGLSVLCILTDSTPFKSSEDIVESFFTNEKSDGQGNSFFGGGALISGFAASAPSNKALIVGSRVLDNSGYSFIMGKKQGVNDFAVVDVSDIFSQFAPCIKEGKFNNIFIVPVFIPDNDKNSFINGDYIRTLISTLGDSKASDLHITYYKDGIVDMDKGFNFSDKKIEKSLSSLMPKKEYDDSFNIVLHETTKIIDNIPIHGFRDYEDDIVGKFEIAVVGGVNLNVAKKTKSTTSNDKPMRLRDVVRDGEMKEKGSAVTRLATNNTTYTTSVTLVGLEDDYERLTGMPIALLKNNITKILMTRLGFYTAQKANTTRLKDFNFLENENLMLTKDEKKCIKDNAAEYSPELFIDIKVKVLEIRNTSSTLKLTNLGLAECFEALGRGTMAFTIDAVSNLKKLLCDCFDKLENASEDMQKLNNEIFAIKESTTFEIPIDDNGIGMWKEGRPIAKLVRDNPIFGLKAGDTLNKKKLKAAKLILSEAKLLVEFLNSKTGEIIPVEELTLWGKYNGLNIKAMTKIGPNVAMLTVCMLTEPDGNTPLQSVKDYYDRCFPHRKMFVNYGDGRHSIISINGVPKNKNKGGGGCKGKVGVPPFVEVTTTKAVRFEDMPPKYKVVVGDKIEDLTFSASDVDAKVWLFPYVKGSRADMLRVKIYNSLLYGIQTAVYNGNVICDKTCCFQKGVSEKDKDINKDPDYGDPNAYLQIFYTLLFPHLKEEYDKLMRKVGSSNTGKNTKKTKGTKRVESLKNIENKSKADAEKEPALQSLFDAILGEESSYEKWEKNN